MLTAAAARSLPTNLTVLTSAALARRGMSPDATRRQIAARRWQRFGRAIVLHNATPSLDERRAIALVNCGELAVLTAFTAASVHGLTGWDRDVTHVLVPGGTRVRRVAVAPVSIHYCGDRSRMFRRRGRRLQQCAPALVIAAGTFDSPRPGCGLLAAGVQQRLVTASELRSALEMAPRARHRALLLNAVDDIAQGAQALSEIDLGRLCRRHGLAQPIRQGLRVDSSGRRRYVDAEWISGSGRHVVVEVDGALHLAPRRWWDDAFRQNELVISGDVVLRFPSVVLRTDEAGVVDQLRRALT